MSFARNPREHPHTALLCNNSRRCASSTSNSDSCACSNPNHVNRGLARNVAPCTYRVISHLRAALALFALTLAVLVLVIVVVVVVVAQGLPLAFVTPRSNRSILFAMLVHTSAREVSRT